MPAKKGFQRLTIDITKESHVKLKMMATIAGKSMHSMIVESIEKRINGFKGLATIEKLKAQNSK